MAKLTKTILIAEDDLISRTLLRDILAEAGYRILESSDGQEAYEVLAKEPVDLLITDRSMPGLGGLELLKKLKDTKITVPSLMVSAYGEESFWSQAIGLGALDYLLKPFAAEEVLKVVNKAFRGEKKK